VDEEQVFTEITECRWAIKRHFGPAVTGRALWVLLGYRSLRSFQRGVATGQVTVPLRARPRGRSHYAVPRDLAAWLVTTGVDWRARIKTAWTNQPTT
jgi:hypothetical protein